MLKNYLIASYRSLTQQTLYSLLNIFGLAVGLAAAIITIIYVAEELNYDKRIPEHDQLYRLVTTYNYPGRAPRITANAFLSILPMGNIGNSVFKIKSLGIL